MRVGKSRPVSRVLSRAIIPLGSPSPRTSSGLPGSARGSALRPPGEGRKRLPYLALLQVGFSVASRPPVVPGPPIRRSPDFPPPPPLLAKGSDCPADSRGSRYGRGRRSQILAAFFLARAFSRHLTPCRGRPIRTRRGGPARRPRRGWLR